MVIAHVLSSFQVGGQERMAASLAAGQVARGHQVMAISLAAPPDGPLAASLTQNGVTTHTVAKRGPTVDPTLPVRLAALLRWHRVQLVHTHNPQPLIYAGMAGRMAGATVVQTRHGVAFHSEAQRWLVRQAARLADVCVVVSAELALNLRQARAVSDERLWVIENGINIDDFRPDAEDRRQTRAAWGMPEDACVIGTVSRLVPLKNVGGLLRALLPGLGPSRRLVVLGDGPERAALERQAAGDGKGGFVTFLGQRHDVPRILRALDIFVLFSRTEGHPLVVLEAMATGLPVVATSVGGLSSIVDEGATGRLVAPEDEASLASAVEDLVADSALRQAMGRRARQTALARFGAARMVDEYLALYARCGQVAAP